MNHNHRGRSPGNWRAPLYVTGHSMLNLLIIAFSQVASLVYTIASGSVPAFEPLMLVMMVAMAVAGSVAGKGIASRITDRGTDVLYALTLIVVMLLSARNFLVLL